MLLKRSRSELQLDASAVPSAQRESKQATLHGVVGQQSIKRLFDIRAFLVRIEVHAALATSLTHDALQLEHGF
jgi:hypothetical protein